MSGPFPALSTLALLALLALIFACGESTLPESYREPTNREPTSASSSTGDGGGHDAANDVASQDASTSGRAPRFLTFGTNVRTITSGESVVVSAVLTDPDGVDDIVGGTLHDERGGAVYGAFSTHGAEGAYSLTLAWDAINQVASIDLGQGEDVERVIVAEFFDVAGNKISKSTSIRLTCGDRGACAGKCVDLMNDDRNCGECGRRCDRARECAEGLCFALEECLSTIHGTSCSEVCEFKGKTAGSHCGGNIDECGMAYREKYGGELCALDSFAWTTQCEVAFSDGISSVKCCCGE
ncbi:MAG: hypothetical protein H6729_06410 [Deltaproteobacteria bacterium]|nr:hypothetical protein [Deltaproteobacteria bacterium]